ncbi:MAG TPA: hypothetical protein VLI66_06840 [Terrabacter sp.]|nr:hypothetical protein [Terrabacter sp.]
MGEQPRNESPQVFEVDEVELRDRPVDEAPHADAIADADRDGVRAGFSDATGDDGLRPAFDDGRIAAASPDDVDVRDQGDVRDDGEDGEVGAGPDGGHVRVGEETSSGVKYSQEITSPDEEPEREGRSLATTHHEVIKEWAEVRGATPATVDGTEHGDHLGVLRLDFGGNNQNLRQVGWDEWFHTFDVRRLNFIYQENRRDGRQSNFFRVESPDREDG